MAITLLSTTVSHAQNREPRNSFDAGIGYHFGAYRNLTLSPVSIYDTQHLVYQLSYSRLTRKNGLFQVNFQGWKSQLVSEKIPSLNLDYTNYRLDIGYLFRIFQTDHLALHAGVVSRTINSEFNSINPDPGRLIAGEIQNKLSLSARLSYDIDQQHAVSTQLTMPLLFFVFGNLDTSIYTFDEYQGVMLSTQYRYAFSQNWAAMFRYFFGYDKVKSSNDFGELQNQFLGVIQYRF